MLKLKLPTWIPILTAAICLSLPATQAHAEDFESIDPYYAYEEDATSFDISQKDYADITAELELALTDLIKMNKEQAPQEGGRLAHKTLTHAIKKSLKENKNKHAFLLFGHVLERALDVDKVYLTGIDKLDPQSANEVYDQANVILRFNIAVAMDYYFQDLRDLGVVRTDNGGLVRAEKLPARAPKVEGVLPLPSVRVAISDWADFAEKSIALFLQEITRAPNATSATEVTRRALGWTARALNTSPERNSNLFATAIKDLAEKQQDLKEGAATIANAQELLKRVSELLRHRPSKANSTKMSTVTRTQVDTTAFPVARKDRDKNPATASEGDVAEDSTTEHASHDGFFPLVSESASHRFSPYWQEPLWKKILHRRESESQFLIDHQIGGGVMGDYSADKGFKLHSQLNARAALLYSNYRGNANSEVSLNTVYLDAKGIIAPQSMPIYRVKVTAAAAKYVGLGAWLAFEANQFRDVQDKIVRMGWGPVAHAKIDDNSYYMVRVGVGTHFMTTQLDPRWGSALQTATEYKTTHKGEIQDNGHLSVDLNAIYRAGAFLVQVDISVDRLRQTGEKGGTRVTAGLDLTIPLGAIFGEDAIKAGASVTKYGFGGNELQQLYANRVNVLSNISYMFPF